MTQTFKRFQQGFTVIEVAVVVAVLAILASIILVSYASYREDARDVERKSDVQQIAAALKAYANWKNNFVEAGSACGAGGDGNGWVSAGNSDIGTYPASIVSCLQSAKVLKDGDFVDPSGCVWDSGGACGSGASGTPAKAYMKATCTKGGVKKTFVFAYLETQPANNAVIDNLCDTGTITGFTGVYEDWGSRYGMNYYVEI